MIPHRWLTREVDAGIDFFDQEFCERCGLCRGEHIISGKEIFYRSTGRPSTRRLFPTDCDREIVEQRAWEERSCVGRGQPPDWYRLLDRGDF